jgi:hypothetical protein
MWRVELEIILDALQRLRDDVTCMASGPGGTPTPTG